MSDEYTYEFPDTKSFMYTLRRFLEAKREIVLSELLKGAECSFESYGQFSRIRWNTYNATIYLTVQVEQLSKFTDDLKDILLSYADSIFPKNAGYELQYIEISPLLSLPPNDEVMNSVSVNAALLMERYQPVWGEPGNDDNYQCDVFMIMPFREDLDKVYTKIIKSTVESLDLSIRRGDDPFTSKEIMYDVWSMLNACELVIADCTDRNPNVFYELGIAHTLGKPVIMLTQNLKELPFDIVGKRAIEYDIAFHQIDSFKTKLRNAIQSLFPTQEKPDDSAGNLHNLPF